MAWTNSKAFTQPWAGYLDRSVAADLDLDTFNAALYTDAITPDNTVALANTAYNVGVWGTANEVYQAGQWAQGGVALTTPDITATGTTITWDAANTASGSAFTTPADAYGVLVYDATVSSYGVSYNYLGGPNGVTNGTFTVVWSGSGIVALSTA